MGFAEELIARRVTRPFVPFAIILNDATQYVVKEASSFAMREKDMMLATASKGMVRITFADISRIEDRRPMTDEQEKVREELVAHLNRTPFSPFVIEMNDGSSFEIVRRWQAAIGMTKGTVISADDKINRNFHIREIRSIKDSAIA